MSGGSVEMLVRTVFRIYAGLGAPTQRVAALLRTSVSRPGIPADHRTGGLNGQTYDGEEAKQRNLLVRRALLHHYSAGPQTFQRPDARC